MARPKFYLDTKPLKDGKFQLLLSYSFNGHRLKYYPNINIGTSDYVAEYWKGNKKPIKTTAAFGAQYNVLLKNIAADAVKLVTEAKGDNLNPTYIREQLDLIYKPKPIEPQIVAEMVETSFIKFFEKIIVESKSGKRTIKSGRNIGEKFGDRAIKNYGVTLSALHRYLDFIGETDLLFADINKDFYGGFKDFCFNEEQKEKSTFGAFLKNINSLMAESGHQYNRREFIIPNYEANTIYLTNKQIEALADLDLSNSEKYAIDRKGVKIHYPTLERVRDLYLIGAYSGLRFSDFGKLDIKSVEGNFIKLRQQKTGGRVVIPIMSKLKPTLAKYPNELPTISNQKFNDYIKHVAELAGLTQEQAMTNTKGNKLNNYKAPLYTLISSHSCRRSYATNMFKAGVPPLLIMSATGHKTETSFLKYIRATNEDKANLLAETFKKLGL